MNNRQTTGSVDLTRVRYNDLDKIKQEFLKYAPAYAIDEAKQAIDKIYELQSQGVIRSGLYYVVLVDLVGSTKFAADHGNDAASGRVQFFVSSSFRALNECDLRNVGLFVKEIGDAVLFVFQHFVDILRWRGSLGACLALGCTEHGAGIQIRTCIHVGEVALSGVNPLSLAVSQCFKMEKKVGAGEVVLTETAYRVAWPTIARAYHGFEVCGEVELDGFAKPVSLHRLVLNDVHDLKRITVEGLD